MAVRQDFLARAAEALVEAEAASLENVRERCLRSAAAWNEMAAAATRAETMRSTRVANEAVSEHASPAQGLC